MNNVCMEIIIDRVGWGGVGWGGGGGNIDKVQGY
jgi:hypothetical protein